MTDPRDKPPEPVTVRVLVPFSMYGIARKHVRQFICRGMAQELPRISDEWKDER